MKTTFTFPGKMGDAIMQWPVAFWWHRQTGEPFDVWLDERTCAKLVPLIEGQPGVEAVELRKGIESYHCGGQPWNFGLDGTEHEGRRIVHLGMRAFPQHQLTLQAFEDATINVEVDRRELANTPVFDLPAVERQRDQLLIHGMGAYPHNRQPPSVWRFVADRRRDFEELFGEILFIGSDDDREVGLTAYPGWGEFKDGGNLKAMAEMMAASRLVVACGSSMAALAGALKVPCIRVHDPIGSHPKVIWSNLGDNQLNINEVELRLEWPAFRDRWLKEDPCTSSP